MPTAELRWTVGFLCITVMAGIKTQQVATGMLDVSCIQVGDDVYSRLQAAVGTDAMGQRSIRHQGHSHDVGPLA